LVSHSAALKISCIALICFFGSQLVFCICGSIALNFLEEFEAQNNSYCSRKLCDLLFALVVIFDLAAFAIFPILFILCPLKIGTLPGAEVTICQTVAQKSCSG